MLLGVTCLNKGFDFNLPQTDGQAFVEIPGRLPLLLVVPF